MEKKVKVYVTKWWRPEGIIEIEAEEGRPFASFGDGRIYYSVKTDRAYWPENLLPGRDAFLSLEDAKLRVKELKEKKIASLRKQISKIELTEVSVVKK